MVLKYGPKGALSTRSLPLLNKAAGHVPQRNTYPGMYSVASLGPMSLPRVSPPPHHEESPDRREAGRPPYKLYGRGTPRPVTPWCGGGETRGSGPMCYVKSK